MAAAGEWAIPHLTQFGDNGILLGTGLIGALVGGGAGAATSLDGTMYNYLMHPQRQQKAEDLASCASVQACQAVQSYWDGIDASQGAALAQNLIDNGGISSELAAQLQSADPLSATYAQLLTQAIGQAGQNNPASLMSSYLAYANQYDGEPMAGPSLTGSTQAQINQINGALLGPVFGVVGNATQYFGGTPQQVAAGYDFGGIVLGAATTVAELNPGATSIAKPIVPAGESAVDPAAIQTLGGNGVKFTPDNVLATGTAPNGQTFFLEIGSSNGGLQHIIDEHANDFANIGVPESQIPSFIMQTVTDGNIVGYQGVGTGRAIYRVTINGQQKLIAISVGKNGFIVGANPAGSIK